MNKLWGDMDAAERLTASIGYLEYNYGEQHPYAKAARAGDLRAFRNLTKHVSEMADVRITGIVDARDPQQVAA